MSYEKDSLSSILVWVRFPHLGMHYRGERCLKRIAGMLGNVVRVDNATMKKDRMMFARVLVELDINEDDELVVVTVEYE